MKAKNTPFNIFQKHLFLGAFSLLFLASCGSYEYASSYDGVYGEPVVYRAPQNTYPSRVVEREEGDVSGTFYKNYFGEKANQLEINMNATDTVNPDVFTDIDGYSSANFVGDAEFGGGSYAYTEGYGGWGDQTESVIVNYYNTYPYYGYGFGYPYYGYGFGYPFYGYGFGFSRFGYGYPFYGGFGYGGYGYYSPYRFGFGFGYGYPYYGGYGFGFGYGFSRFHSPYYGGFSTFGHGGHHVAYNSSRRGSISSTTGVRSGVRSSDGRVASNTNAGRRVSDVRNTAYYRNRVSADRGSAAIRSRTNTGRNTTTVNRNTSDFRSTAYYSRRVNSNTRGNVNGTLSRRSTDNVQSGNSGNNYRSRSAYRGNSSSVRSQGGSSYRTPRSSNGNRSSTIRSGGGTRSSGSRYSVSGAARNSSGVRSSGGGRSSGGAVRSSGGGGGGGRSGGAVRSGGGRGNN